MKVFSRICIKDFAVTDGHDTASVQRGHEYTTSDEHDDQTVMVFTNFWFRVPVSNFGGEIEGLRP